MFLMGKPLELIMFSQSFPQSYIADIQGFLLADTENNLIMLAGTDYQDLYTTVFEISYKKGLYDLHIYYEADTVTEDI